MIAALLIAVTPLLVRSGVQLLVFLPRAIEADRVASEAMQQIIEGGWSTLPGETAPVRGLRFATGMALAGDATLRPALWLADADRIGFLTADGRYVLIRLDAVTKIITRSLPAPTVTCATVPAGLDEEWLPYDVSGGVQIVPTGPVFQYYNQSGALVAPSCPPDPAIRRMVVTLRAQTGTGIMEEGHAREELRSAVAIRVP